MTVYYYSNLRLALSLALGLLFESLFVITRVLVSSVALSYPNLFIITKQVTVSYLV
jgi:hypothetical protein